MHRFFVQKEHLPNIYGEDVHHIKNVLRLQPGDIIELLDGQGKTYSVKIDQIQRDKITCEILTIKENTSGPKVSVSLAQCLPKAKKMDWVIQKSSELGVRNIIPVISERTIAKGEKLNRWQAIAKESAQQCGLPFIPKIEAVQSYSKVIEKAKNYSLALIPWELEKSATLKSVISNSPIFQFSNSPLPQSISILILIGPEGGFSQKEIQLANEAGFVSVSLGPRILRTETAGMAILAMLNYAFEQ